MKCSEYFTIYDSYNNKLYEIHIAKNKAFVLSFNHGRKLSEEEIKKEYDLLNIIKFIDPEIHCRSKVLI